MVANTPTVLDLNLEAAVFFRILDTNLLSSKEIKNNKSKKESNPKKRKNHIVLGLLSAVLCIE